MKRVGKWLKWVGISLLSLFILLCAVLYFFERQWGDAIVRVGLEALNEELKVPVATDGVEFTFFANFPHASLHFRNVRIRCNPRLFNGQDTLLQAQNVFLVLNPFELLKGRFRLEELKVEEGVLILLRNKQGLTNYDILRKEAEESQTPVDFELDRFTLSGMGVRFADGENGFFAHTQIQRITARVAWRQNQSHLEVSGQGLIHRLGQGEFLYSNNQRFSLLAQALQNGQTWLLGDSHLTIDGDRVNLQGTLDLAHNHVDVQMYTPELNLETVLKFASQYKVSLPKEVELEGRMAVKLHIHGPFAGNKPLRIDMETEGKNLELHLMAQEFSIQRLAASFTSGAQGTLATSALNVHEFKLRRGRSTLSSMLNINNFRQPSVKLSYEMQILQGEVQIPSLAHILKEYELIASSGQYSAKFTSPASILTEWHRNPSLKLDLAFKGLVLNPMPNERIEGMEGAFTMINNNLVKGAVEAIWRGANVSVGLNVKNALSMINGQGKARITTNTTISNLRIDEFPLPTSQDSATDSAKSWNPWEHIELLEGIVNVNQSHFRDGAIDSLTATLRGTNQHIRLNLLNAKAFDGDLTGSVQITNHKAGSQLITAELHPKHINLPSVFSQFNNFGLKGLTNENLEGRLTGTISLHIPILNGKFQQNQLKVQSDVNVYRGVLKNVKALESLAKFIQLDELQNIQFSTLSNRITIDTSCVNIPKMQVHSSAIDLSLHGQQLFNSSYKYHIGLKLSDILFNRYKARPEFNPDDAFQEISGHGGWLYMVISGDSTTCQIAYDREALRERVKAMIQQEKEELKQVFIDDFGPDSLRRSKDHEREKTPIIWDENDK